MSRYRVLFTISCCKFTVNFITQSCNFKTLQTRSFRTPLTVTIKFTSQNLGGTWPAAARVSPRWQKERPWERGWHHTSIILNIVCILSFKLPRNPRNQRENSSCFYRVIETRVFWAFDQSAPVFLKCYFIIKCRVFISRCTRTSWINRFNRQACFCTQGIYTVISALSLVGHEMIYCACLTTLQHM
jgi:hypothetical protein